MVINKFNYQIVLLILVCGVVSIGVLGLNPNLFGYLLTAFGLGLRHGLDTDHIAVIDNISRKLVNENQDGSCTGLFFAAGHSTIVFIMTIMVVLGFNSSQSYFQRISELGGNWGTLLSIIFLTLTFILNLLMVQVTYRGNKVSAKTQPSQYASYYLRSINSPNKMYFVGFLFGLSFDTATEISLLALAAVSLLEGVSNYLVLLLPVGFACGMIITDTVNSIFMSKVYSKVQNNLQQLKLYNYLILGFASLATLVTIIIELSSYLKEQFNIDWLLLNVISKFNNYSELFGGAVITIFVIIGLIIYSTPMNSHKG